MSEMTGDRYRGLVASMTALLARRDPLGLGAPAGDLSPGEYGPEAAEVVRKLIRNGSPTDELAAEAIYEVFKESFGPDDVGSRDTYLQLAPDVVAVMTRGQI